MGSHQEIDINIIDAQLNFLDTSLDFQREVSCFATSVNGVISITTNDHFASVEFDFFEIWQILKSNDPKAKMAYMIHSHPKGMNRMSSIDENMVYGWELALGIPIYFHVVTDEGIAKYICFKDKNKKPETIFLMFSEYDNKYISSDLYLLSMVVYGLSLAPDIKQYDLTSIQKELQESRLKELK